MRAIERTGRFKKDYRREMRKYGPARLEAELRPVLAALLQDVPLEAGNFDHVLVGDWATHRECHIKPDLLLIYQKPDQATLRLVRLGSHSELGL